MSVLIVVPARYGSTRLPAKPLHKIAGRTLLSRVVHLAKEAAALTGAEVVVATDHEEIMAHAKELGVNAVMTDPNCPSGTDRALEAVKNLGRKDVTFVVNLQGDAPFTEAAHVAAVIELGQKGQFDVVTPVTRMEWDALDGLREKKKVTPFSGTTCARDEASGRAYWFSKNIIPAIQKEAGYREKGVACPVCRHIGLYGYSVKALETYVGLPMGFYEKFEGLEQLRFLENGMTVGTVVVKTPRISMNGIDSPEDVVQAEALIAKHGDLMAGV